MRHVSTAKMLMVVMVLSLGPVGSVSTELGDTGPTLKSSLIDDLGTTITSNDSNSTMVLTTTPETAVLCTDDLVTFEGTVTPPMAWVVVKLSFYRVGQTDQDLRMSEQSVNLYALEGYAIDPFFATDESGKFHFMAQAGDRGQGEVVGIFETIVDNTIIKIGELQLTVAEGEDESKDDDDGEKIANAPEGGCCPDSTGSSSEVAPSGGTTLSVTDTTITARTHPRLHYTFRRTYRSRASNLRPAATNDFGVDWAMTYSDDRLIQDSDNVIVFRDSLRTDLFIATGTPGLYLPPMEYYEQLRINNDGDFELRDRHGLLKTYEGFDHPDIPGRLIKMKDRNNNEMTFHYREIDPDETNGPGGRKFVLAFVIEAMGREVRYQYYARLNDPGTPQLDADGRVLTIHSTNPGALGRLACVKDFKGDMNFDGVAESEDFPGQVNNRIVSFDYDDESNLISVTRSAVQGTPNRNDFPDGKTFRYTYIKEPNVAPSITGPNRKRLLHNLLSIEYPNETAIDPNNPREKITYGVDPADPDFDRAVTYTRGGTNGYGVSAGGTINYSYEIVSMSAATPNDPYIKTTVTDRRGNVTEHIYSAFDTLLEKRELTRGFRKGEPTAYVRESDFNIDKEPIRSMQPEGNVIQWFFNDESPDRFQQGNIIRVIRTPDANRALQTDQAKLEQVIVYEPIYNHEFLVISPRGADILHNDFDPPILDPAAAVRQVTDPYDPNKTVDLRYTRVRFFDYQEPTERADDAPNDRLDIDGTGGRINESPLIGEDPNVLTTEVRLVQELGLPEDANGLQELRDRLNDNMINLGLADLNGDGIEGVLDEDGLPTPTIAGNIIRIVYGSPVLIEGSNQHALEQQIEAVGDLTNEALGYMHGGAQEGTYGGRLQTVVAMFQYNRFGQVVKTISPEGNVTTFEYFPEIDPDGDGHFSIPVRDLTDDCWVDLRDFSILADSWLDSNCTDPGWCSDADIDRSGDVNMADLSLFVANWLECLANTAADGRTLGTETGGYLKKVTRDDSRIFVAQNYTNSLDPVFSNNNTDPAVTKITTSYTYDDVGNITSETNGRGIRTDYFVNELNQIVQTTRAADISAATSADPPDPLVGDPLAPLTAFAYLSRTFYDYNYNVVLAQIEDRGNTSHVDGSGLGTLPAHANDTTPGLSSADTGGSVAFVDTLNLYDILDNPIETRREVDSTHCLVTRYRYDPSENKVLVIYPEGNADSFIYDERDLVFQETKGPDTRPTEGWFAINDPTTFELPGRIWPVPSTTTYNYDKNGNRIEWVDAYNGGGTASIIAGFGDVTRYTYDGYDRPKSVTDPLGNVTSSFYDAGDNVVRTIADGEPIDDVAGDSWNRTLAVTEYVHDSLSRVIATHRVLFETPDVPLNRPVKLTDMPEMDSFAPYLADAGFDMDIVPGALPGITIIGRVTKITEYDRQSRPTFNIQDDLDINRTDYDGADRSIKTIDGALSNGFIPGNPGSFNPAAVMGNTVEMAYDDVGNLIENLETDVTDVMDVSNEQFRTTYLYNALDRLQTHADNLGQAMDYRYDSRGNLTARADAAGPVTGRSISRRGLGSAAPVTVNDFGNVARQFYDGIGRLLMSQAVLTASGQGDGEHIGATLEGIKNVGGASDIPTPDLDQAEDGLINICRAWGDNSQLLALRDDDGSTTGYIYDSHGNTYIERRGLYVPGTAFALDGGDTGSFLMPIPVSSDPPVNTEPNGTDLAFLYYQDNLAEIIDEAGNNIYIFYDALNRMNYCYIGSTAGFIGTEQEWMYDGLSRMTFNSNNNVTCTYVHDSLSRVIEQGQTIEIQPTKFISLDYEISAVSGCGSCGAQGQPSATTYPDGRKIHHRYDNLGRLISRADDNGSGGTFTPLATYQYIGRDRIASLTYQNDTRLTYIGQSHGANADVGYDGLRRIVNKRWEKANGQPLGQGDLIVGFGHQKANGAPAYDRMNNKLIEEKLHSPDNSEVYRYDSSYRLTTFDRGTLNTAKDAVAISTILPGALQAQGWNLDGVGNWIDSSHTTGGITGTETRTHTDYSEIYDIAGTPLPGNVFGTMQHDKNGNLTDDGKRLMKWDALNRLREVRRKSDNQLVAVYFYDCMGRRFRKVVTNGGIDNDPSLNGTTDFYYDNWQVIEEHDGSDNILRQYVYGVYIDEPLVIDDRSGGITIADLNDGTGAERLFYHQNTRFSTLALTNSAGAIVEGYLYDAYGLQTVFTAGANGVVDFGGDDVLNQYGVSAVWNPYLFTGRRYDPETGWYYYRTRYFDSRAGRFITRDTIGMWRDSTNLGNGYAYVGNNPFTSFDPMGLKGHNLKMKKFCPKGWEFVAGPSTHEPIVVPLPDLTEEKGMGRYRKKVTIEINRQNRVDYEWEAVPGIKLHGNCGQAATFVAAISWEKSSQHTISLGVILNVPYVPKETAEVTGAYEYSWGTTEGKVMSIEVHVEKDPCYEPLGIPVVLKLKASTLGARRETRFFGGRIEWVDYQRQIMKPIYTGDIGVVVCKKKCK